MLEQMDAVFALVAGALMLLVLYVWSASGKKPAGPAEVDVERLLRRLAPAVARKASTIGKTWATFDKQKTKTVPKGAFTQVLAYAKIEVSEREADALCEIFASPDDADLVLYKAFLQMCLPSRSGPSPQAAGAGADADANSDSDGDSEEEQAPSPRRRRTPKGH